MTETNYGQLDLMVPGARIIHRESLPACFPAEAARWNIRQTGFNHLVPTVAILAGVTLYREDGYPCSSYRCEPWCSVFVLRDRQGNIVGEWEQEDPPTLTDVRDACPEGLR